MPVLSLRLQVFLAHTTTPLYVKSHITVAKDALRHSTMLLLDYQNVLIQSVLIERFSG
jgi:hypothetical protein